MKFVKEVFVIRSSRGKVITLHVFKCAECNTKENHEVMKNTITGLSQLFDGWNIEGFIQCPHMVESAEPESDVDEEGESPEIELN